MLKEFLITADLNEQLTEFTNRRLMILNKVNKKVEKEEFNTPKFSNTFYFILLILLIYLLI
jgi:hypothetical protein